MPQLHYGYKFSVALPGMISGYGEYRTIPLTNSVGLTTQSFELTIPALPSASSVYRIKLTPVVGFEMFADYKTDSSPTQSEVLNGMFLAIANSQVNDYYATSLDVLNNKIKLVSRNYGVNHAIAQVAADPEPIPGALITITQTVAGANPTSVPYGRFVAKNPATMTGDEATLPTQASGLEIRGVTMSTHFNMKDSIGPAAKIHYKPLDIMNVLTHCLGLEGVWVEADSVFNENATLYIETQRPALLGTLTTIPTNNIALPGNVSLVEPAQRIDVVGKYAALVYLG